MDQTALSSRGDAGIEIVVPLQVTFTETKETQRPF
jgi:hypothetical protein